MQQNSTLVALDKARVEAYGNRGFIYLEIGNQQEALEDFQIAAQLFEEQFNSFPRLLPLGDIASVFLHKGPHLVGTHLFSGILFYLVVSNG